ncbi:unnamed protein product [Larinioides sclopetarius]
MQWKATGNTAFLRSIFTRKVEHDMWLSAFRVPTINGHASIKESTELVATDGLQRLDMRKKERDEEDLILTMLTAETCKDLRTILCQGLHFFTNNDAIDAVVRLSPNLEELHYPELVSLDAFENCKRIRIIKFHRLNKKGGEYFQNKDAKFPESLKNLEVFAFCCHYQASIPVHDMISKVLESCPKVVSVGSIDSSKALELLQKKNADSHRQFQLRRCYWANGNDPTSEDNASSLPETRQFSVIQAAVKMCPLLEELIIKVSDPTCLTHLQELKNLSALYIAFDQKSNENIFELISLIKVIGPQLKHLSIEDKGEVPIDDILEYCSKLESLQIKGTMIVTESFKASYRFVPLKHLFVSKTDESSLLTLLRKCKHLTELVLELVPWFDDNVFHKILRKNMLSKLEVFMISRHDLSDESFELLLGSMRSLQNIGVAFSLEYYIKYLVRNLNHRVQVHKFFQYVGYHDFFSKIFDRCRF